MKTIKTIITARDVIEASKKMRSSCNGKGPQMTFHFCEGSDPVKFFGEPTDLQSPKAALFCLDKFVTILNKVASTEIINKKRSLQ